MSCSGSGGARGKPFGGDHRLAKRQGRSKRGESLELKIMSIEGKGPVPARLGSRIIIAPILSYKSMKYGICSLSRRRRRLPDSCRAAVLASIFRHLACLVEAGLIIRRDRRTANATRDEGMAERSKTPSASI